MSEPSFDELLDAVMDHQRQENNEKINQHVEQLRNAHLPDGVTLSDEDEQALGNHLRRCMAFGAGLYVEEEGQVTRESVLLATDNCMSRCDPHLATMIPDLRQLCEKAVVRGIRHMQETGF